MIFADLIDQSFGLTWTAEMHVLPRQGDVISLDPGFFPEPAATGYVVRQVMHRLIGTRHEIEVIMTPHEKSDNPSPSDRSAE